MYEFDNLAIARWYLVDAEDVSFDRETAIIGGTGAGKSTLLDAMKTVVSGNNRNVLDLNSAAGDRQDRTVRDYCLGCVTDVNGGKPTRERCETTLAMSFVDSETGHAISIGVMLVADKDQPGEETKRFVADGYAFRIADFVERREDGNEYTMSHDAMVAKMRAKLGPKRFDTFQQSSRYVADYLHRMRPRNPPDAKAFLRSFGNALRAKEIKDPTSFVRNFVLEALPTNIKRVQESIGLWRELEDEVKRLEVMLQALRVIRGRFNTGFSRRLELETATFMEKHLTRLDLECLAEQVPRRLRDIAQVVVLDELGVELVWSVQLEHVTAPYCVDRDEPTIEGFRIYTALSGAAQELGPLRARRACGIDCGLEPSGAAKCVPWFHSRARARAGRLWPSGFCCSDLGRLSCLVGCRVRRRLGCRFRQDRPPLSQETSNP